MNKTIYSLLAVMLITGMLFTACGPTADVDEDENTTEEEEMMEEEGDDHDDDDDDDDHDHDDDEDHDHEEDEDEDDDAIMEDESAETSTTDTRDFSDSEVEVEVEVEDDTSSEEPSFTVDEEVTTVTPEPETKYKDGTYTAAGSYTAPPGLEQMDVSLTIKDDKITDVSIRQKAEDSVSKNYQKNFAASISGVVVGKTLENATVGVVAGASLTKNGFNKAVGAIQSQAKN